MAINVSKALVAADDGALLDEHNAHPGGIQNHGLFAQRLRVLCQRIRGNWKVLGHK